MKRLLLLGTLLLGSELLACCCEAEIRTRATAIDSLLASTNSANAKGLEKLKNSMNDLNEKILVNRTTEIKDSDLQKELAKFKMTSAKNTYHSNSMPTGLLFYQMEKIANEKQELIESISTQTDLILLNSSANIESLKGMIFETTKKQKESTNKIVKEMMKK